MWWCVARRAGLQVLCPGMIQQGWALGPDSGVAEGGDLRMYRWRDGVSVSVFDYLRRWGDGLDVM
ncbi:hypothetical protein CXF35_03675 [Corynebacterium bovis]|uniref:Uncharacterized protein n=1 Tax=Corynebacterium bovis TaxID=36808 RepID=A0A426Q7C4_9CORY|nr:hypothetical protein CXF40_09220 [Corynebacterium bovis]RRO99457.1 hypothetical protein CXF41_09510 [Corynebacterium bovis]RRQ04294.1 hypothetical protein CXF39_02255 [Corynebacterium bovis]RRQ05602.1 hypothetical protein CXF42_00245 [Corynebacterium bovis]RRQ11356.1 hypothetical protein CXF34_04090 [Corynebacterium bovis]